MFKNTVYSLSILKQMLCADFVGFKSIIKNKLIDVFIYIGITIAVMGYLLTGFGIRTDFGIFTAATLVGIIAMFELYPRTAAIIMDLKENKAITYDLILPLPSWLAIARIAITTALQSLLISFCSLPITFLFVYNQFDPRHFATPWFIALLVINSLFAGFFSLFLASFALPLSSCWTRIIFPLWILGGFQFTWEVLYTKSHVLGYLALMNPFLYAQEGMRSAILGGTESLPCWICFVALVCFTTLCGWVSVKRMMKRLDCV